MTRRDHSQINRFGWLAVLALVLLQVVAASHAIAAEHSLDERCQICLITERTDDAAPAVEPAVAPAADLQPAPAGTLQELPPARPAIVRSRGPPIL